jgi:hypothetical protein
MPTLTVTHEAPLELIRQHPSLAAELVRATLSIRCLLTWRPGSARLT